MQTTTTTSFERESPLLPKGLPPLALRGTATLLIGLFVATVLVAVLVSLPESARGTFVLVPERGSNPLSTSRQGVVSKVLIENGQTVKEGELLFVVRSSELRALSAE
jgi:multidrug efflux pump subunit AcrA (membrane-fusion protein)